MRFENMDSLFAIQQSFHGAYELGTLSDNSPYSYRAKTGREDPLKCEEVSRAAHTASCLDHNSACGSRLPLAFMIGRNLHHIILPHIEKYGFHFP